VKRFTLVLALAAVLAGPAAAQVVNRIVAVVDEEIITQVEIDREAATLLPALAQQSGWSDEEAARRLPDIKTEVLRNLVREKLFEHEVAKLGIPVSEGDIDEYLDYLLARNKMTREQLAEMIRQEGKAIGEYRDMIKKKIQREQYVQYRLKSGALDVSDEEVRAYYQRNTEKFAVEPEVTLAEVRLTVPENATPEEEAKVLARAQEAYGMLLAGEPFEAVARRFSDAPTAAGGGLVGTLKLDTELKPAYARVARTLEPGAFSGIARDDRDAFILKLVARPATVVRPLEEVKDEIKNLLYNEKVDHQIAALTDELYRKSFVDVRVEKF
jgi:peptidyl-prolyl cis-trans isomerase SurA